MKNISLFLLIFLFLAAAAVYGQGGGKAEPNRIEFARGTSSKTLTATLSNDEEMEYVFGAAKGQTVTIRNSNTGLFDVRVFREEANFETEFDSSPVLTFVVPETGDYQFFVRKKRVKAPRSARFSVSLAIK